MERKEDMFGDAGEEPVEQAQEPVAETPTEPVEQPEETPEEPVAAVEPAAEKPDPVMVPLAALHETRDEVKALKAQLAALAPSAESQAEPQAPDMFEDPEGWQAFQRQQVDQALYVQRLNMSHRFAKVQHGEDVVAQAVQWADARCDTDPFFSQQVRYHPDPVGFAVENYRRDQIASNVTPETFEQFRAWQAAQQQQPTIAAAQPQIPASRPPPTSLATATSAGTSAPPKANVEEERLGAMFGA